MRLRSLALICLIASLIAAAGGCSVGPRFSRPDVPTPPGYLAAPAVENRAPEPAVPVPSDYAQTILLGTQPSEEWWTQFHSAALDQLVRQAIAANHTLAAAQAAVAQAHELVKSANAALYPQLSANAQAGRNQYGAAFLGTFSLPPFSYVAYGLSASWTPDYLGGVRHAVERQQALAQYQQSAADATYLTLTGNVVIQAMNIAAARAQIEALTELLAEDRDNLNLVTTAFENGSVSKLDVLTAQSQLASDETLLPPLRQQLSTARHALAVLVGQPPASWSAPDFDLAGLTVPRQVPVSLPSELAHRRPDILAAEADLRAATAAVGVATANLYPQITLSASAGQQAVHPEDLFNASSTVWQLLAGVTQPVFDAGRLRAERRAALDAMHASAQRYRQVVLESFGQVADLLDALSHDAQLLAAQANALRAAQSNVELARESYRAGNSGVLQVIDAQRAHQQAQLGFVRAQAQQYEDTTQLALALGGAPGLAERPARD